MRRKRIANIDDLEQRINELESLRAKQKSELQAEFRELAHRLSPTTLIKNGIQTVVGDPELRTAAFDTAVSHGAGRLGKSLLVGKSHNMFRKLAGAVVHFIVANFIRNKIPIFRHKLAAQKNGVS